MDVNCKHCGKDFSVVPAEIKRGGGKFCSRTCRGLGSRKGNNPNWKGGKKEFICDACGKSFEQYLSEYERISRVRKTEQRYCSRDCWSKGYYIHPEGYVYLYKPEHPDSISNGMILEHRFVMEKHIGRRLLPSEVVHHINEDKADNRIENLKLYNSNSDHTKDHCCEWKRDNKGKFTK